MNTALFSGELVRLTAEEPQVLADNIARWARDSEYIRLTESDPAIPLTTKVTLKWIEKLQEQDPPKVYVFGIRTLDGDCLIGDVGLGGIRWAHGDCNLGIGLGDRQDWGKGYGTDAMRLILRYAFTELNLQRVSLDVYAYNPRAIRCYEKAGFVHEGRMRKLLNREGQHWDIIFMGILREEWEKSLPSAQGKGASPASPGLDEG